MATNRDYLEQALNQAKAELKLKQDALTTETEKYNSLTKQLTAERFYYASLQPININKKKESQARQALLSSQIANSLNAITALKTEVSTAQAKVNEVQLKIDQYDAAVAEGLRNGLNEQQATQSGDREIEGVVAAMQATSEAEKTTDTNKNLIRNIIIVVVILAIIALITWLILRNRNAKKSA